MHIDDYEALDGKHEFLEGCCTTHNGQMLHLDDISKAHLLVASHMTFALYPQFMGRQLIGSIIPGVDYSTEQGRVCGSKCFIHAFEGWMWIIEHYHQHYGIIAVPHCGSFYNCHHGAINDCLMCVNSIAAGLMHFRE